AAAISRRAAQHSAEFLNATPAVVPTLTSNKSFRGGLPPAHLQSKAGSSPPLNDSLVTTAIDLVQAFAELAGGIAADAWASVPAAIVRLVGWQLLRLMCCVVYLF